MMIMRSFLVFAFALTTFSLSASAGIDDKIAKSGQYWQRVHTSSAIYLQGPKAQQMLNRNIARCVTELRELERLGAVKDAIPEYAKGMVLSEEEARLAGWDTPERDEELFAEHGDYIDFEGCMLANGWERIKYVPFDVHKQAVKNYKNAHTSTRPKKSKSYKSTHTDDDFGGLND